MIKFLPKSQPGYLTYFTRNGKTPLFLFR